MAANEKAGTYRTSREADLSAYDKLPPTARRALQNAVLCFSAQTTRQSWEAGQVGWRTGAEIAKSIAKLDREGVAKTGKKLWPNGTPPDHHRPSRAASKPDRGIG